MLSSHFISSKHGMLIKLSLNIHFPVVIAVFVLPARSILFFKFYIASNFKTHQILNQEAAWIFNRDKSVRSRLFLHISIINHISIFPTTNNSAAWSEHVYKTPAWLWMNLMTQFLPEEVWVLPSCPGPRHISLSPHIVFGTRLFVWCSSSVYRLDWHWGF